MRSKLIFLQDTIRIAGGRSVEQLRLSEKGDEYVFELVEIDLFVCEMNEKRKRIN